MSARSGARRRKWPSIALVALALALALPLAVGPAGSTVALADEALVVSDDPAANDAEDVPSEPTDGAVASGGGETESPSPEASAETSESDDSEADAVSGVSARVSDDERRIVLTVSGKDAEAASSVAFDVWSEQGGRSALVRHGAARLEDGTWTATVFISSDFTSEPGVPYYCQVDGAVHRLFNRYSGQHFYTSDAGEADSLSRIGWTYEGVAWIDAGDAEGALPIYRLYNPYNGDHFYTSDANEYATLPSSGWRQEGIAYHSDPDVAQPVYRVFNPYARVGAHHYTTDEAEYESLAAKGWRKEGAGWYGAAVNGDGSWSVSSGNRHHGDAGTYHVEAVAIAAPQDRGPSAEDPTASLGGEPVTDAPAETLLGETTFSITAPSASASVADVDEENGTFDVVVDGIESVSGVVRVEVPVWTAEDQHDIVWAMAESQPDGTYRATVSAVDHELAHDYLIHVYLRTGNGLHVNVAQTQGRLELENFVCLLGGPKRYTLTIVNPGPADSVRMPTWSEAGGQDDLRWYEATRDGDRWSAAIDTGNLLDSGRCITHIYVDGAVRKVFTFEVSPKEVLTRRQRAIIAAAKVEPTLPGGYCAGWVSNVLRRAGQPYNMNDDANDMYYRLHLTNLDDLLPGMVVAVSTHSHTWAGSVWGHVGIYLGDGVVIDDVYGYVRRSSLTWWVNYYSDRVPVRFGFLEY